jgi:formyltetrahydrofolate hydrolase
MKTRKNLWVPVGREEHIIGARLVRMSKDVIRIRVTVVIGGHNGDRAFYRP